MGKEKEQQSDWQLDWQGVKTAAKSDKMVVSEVRRTGE